MKQIPRGTSSVIRQRLAAVEVVRFMGGLRLETLHPLPFVPYAIGLALSVSYQHLRQSQVEHQQTDALQDFGVCCRVLQRIRRIWSSADVMATLAKKVLDELERAPDLSVFRVSRTQRQGLEAVEVAVADAMIPPPTACNSDVANASSALLANDHVEQQGFQGDPQTADVQLPDSQGALDAFNLLDNVDDVFGTFMDPNHANFDPSTFLEDLAIGWTDEGFDML